MKRKEYKHFASKIYDVLWDKYHGALVVNNVAIDYAEAVYDFAYDKTIVSLLADDCIVNNRDNIYKTFEKWIINNTEKYSYKNIKENLEKRNGVLYGISVFLTMLCIIFCHL